MRTRTRRSIAAVTVLMISLVTAGCSGSQFGAAAIVGAQQISVETVEASVTGLLNQRRALGDQDSGTVRSGQDARDQIRFHILASAMEQIALSKGITASEGERRALERQFLVQAGGRDALVAAMTQNGIAEVDFPRYLDVVIYQRKLGELLVPGQGEEFQSPRNEAVDALVKAYLAEEQIRVNPRFGVFDASSGFILTRDDTNGVLTLPAE